MNTGHDVKIVLEDPNPHVINISGGSLTYQYRVCEIMIHYGSSDNIGSEHTIDGQSFPAEVSFCTGHTALPYQLHGKQRTLKSLILGCNVA